MTTVNAVERQQALEELSTARAVALRMADSGASEVEVADALGIPVEGVGPLLTVARAKLDLLIADEGPSSLPGTSHAGSPD